MAKPWTDELYCSDLGFSYVAGKLHWVMFFLPFLEHLKHPNIYHYYEIWMGSGHDEGANQWPFIVYYILRVWNHQAAGEVECCDKWILSSATVISVSRQKHCLYVPSCFYIFCYEVSWRHGLSVFKNYVNDNQISACINAKINK